MWAQVSAENQEQGNFTAQSFFFFINDFFFLGGSFLLWRAQLNRRDKKKAISKMCVQRLAVTVGVFVSASPQSLSQLTDN